MSLSRPTASKLVKKLSCTAAVCIGLVSFSAAPALAGKGKEASAAVNAEMAVCPGQTFVQPFEGLQDSNYYTLVQGSEFNEGAQGWELANGAAVTEAARPDGSTGSVLSLPTGAEAVSPPVCVTLAYPTARVYVQNLEGNGAVSVSVAYAGTKSEEKPKGSGQLRGQDDEWGVSKAFDVRPQLGGKTEEVRQVRFHFVATGKNGTSRLFGLYVDPRMS
jgi:hypothetical protein